MKSKITFLIAFLFTLVNNAFAQFSVYEWEVVGINYSSLSIRQPDNTYINRTVFNYNGDKVIIENNAKYVTYPSYAPNDQVLEPTTSVKLIKNSRDPLRSYNADYIILEDFKKDLNKGSRFIVLDKSSIYDRSQRTDASVAKRKTYTTISSIPNVAQYFNGKNDPLYVKYFTSPSQPSSPQSGQLSGGVVNVHVIVAGDILDKNIGEAVSVDVNAMSNLFAKTLANDTRLKVNVIKIVGTALTSENVRSRINSLPNNMSNDVVVFYYSGHGYNIENRISYFPFMAIPGSQFNLEQVKDLINSKGPRTTIVIGDLCNSVVKRTKSIEDADAIGSKAVLALDPEKIEKLFIKSQGWLVSTSSSYGEYSYCMRNNQGGAFTNPFVKNLRNALYKGNGVVSDWSTIFNTTYKEAKNNTSHLTNKIGTKGQTGVMTNRITYKP